MYLDLLNDTLLYKVEEKEHHVGDEAIADAMENEETETNAVGSEEMELHIAHLLDKIENFTQQVVAIN